MKIIMSTARPGSTWLREAYWKVPQVNGVEREMLLLEQMALSKLKD